MNPDVPADVRLRSNSALSEGSVFVGSQRNCLVVQKIAPFSRKMNGVVPTTELVVSLQDKTGKLRRKHQPINISNSGDRIPCWLEGLL